MDKCICDDCIKGKGRATKIGTSVPTQYKATRLLHRIHVDLIGWISAYDGNHMNRVPTLGGNIYSIHATDEFSDRTGHKILKHKSDGTPRSKEFSRSGKGPPSCLKGKHSDSQTVQQFNLKVDGLHSQSVRHVCTCFILASAMTRTCLFAISGFSASVLIDPVLSLSPFASAFPSESELSSSSQTPPQVRLHSSVDAPISIYEYLLLLGNSHSPRLIVILLNLKQIMSQKTTLH